MHHVYDMDDVCLCGDLGATGHLEWCGHRPTDQTSGAMSFDDLPEVIRTHLISVGVTERDWEGYQSGGELPNGMADVERLRGAGVTGAAFKRYVNDVGMDDIPTMLRLAGVGITSVEYEAFCALGISDADRVSRIRMAGYNAETYREFVIRLRRICGRGLSLRLLDIDPVPADFVDLVELNLDFAEVVLMLDETELKQAMSMVNAGAASATVIEHFTS